MEVLAAATAATATATETTLDRQLSKSHQVFVACTYFHALRGLCNVSHIIITISRRLIIIIIINYSDWALCSVVGLGDTYVAIKSMTPRRPLSLWK